MLEMFKKKPKEIDYEFEKEKNYKEFDNNKYVLEELKSKYDEKLKENPIVVLNGISEKDELKEIYRLDTDESGTGGSIGVSFNRGNQYFHTDRKGKISDSIFKGFYKTNEDSLHTIVTIMSDLIARSGYNEKEKSEMQRSIVQYLNSVVKED